MAQVRDLLRQVGPGTYVRLWALDEVADDLAGLINSGLRPGGSFSTTLIRSTKPDLSLKARGSLSLMTTWVSFGVT